MRARVCVNACIFYFIFIFFIFLSESVLTAVPGARTKEVNEGEGEEDPVGCGERGGVVSYESAVRRCSTIYTAWGAPFLEKIYKIYYHIVSHLVFRR